MKKLGREDLLKELEKMSKKGIQFFKKASDELEGVSFSEHYNGSIDKDEFWDHLPSSLRKMANGLISRVIEIAPLIAESARMTPYLTQTDQIDFGHALKGVRSSLRLCHYRYWDPEVLHDEGTVLGVSAAGQSDTQGLYPTDAQQEFEKCFQRIISVVQLLSPSTISHAEFNIERRGQDSIDLEPNTAFVMMWMDPKRPELEDTYNTIKRCFKKFNIKAERADDIEHEGIITEKIIEKIKSSEFLYADLTGRRPNVYYEVGYAHAIQKKVMLYRQSGEKLHFDIAGYNCPEYKNNTDLEKKLINRLSHMTGRTVKK